MISLYVSENDIKKLPAPAPGWVTLGLTKKNEIREFGSRRRLTPGEKLLGGYTKFYHVNTTRQNAQIEVSALSATGRFEFPIKLEIDFVVTDASALITVDDPVEKYLLSPIRRSVFPHAKTVKADDYTTLELILRQQLSPREGGAASHHMFEIVELAVDVQPPAGVTLLSEAEDASKGLNERIIASLARGDIEQANFLEQALKRVNTGHIDSYGDVLRSLKGVLQERSNIEYEIDGHLDQTVLNRIDDAIGQLGSGGDDKTAIATEKEKPRIIHDAEDQKKDEFGDTD